MDLNKTTMKKIFLLLGGAVTLYWALEHLDVLWEALCWAARLVFPLFLGFCIAFVLNVPMRALEKHVLVNPKHEKLKALRRPVCIVLALLFIVAVLAVVLVLVIPEFVNAFGVLANTIPKFVNEVTVWANAHAEEWPAVQAWLAELQIDWAGLGKTLMSYVGTGAGSLLGGTVQVASSVFGGVTNFVIAFILALYILLGKEKLKKQVRAVCRAFLPAKGAAWLEGVTHLAATTFSNFVSGQCIEACILGSLCWLGMALFRLPYAPMVSALVCVMALLPIVGAFISMGVGAFMILMINPLQALIFVLMLLVVQQIEGNLIYPKVVGSKVGLPAIWVLSAVTLGGGLLGIAGMLFAVPVCSILYAMTRSATQRRLLERGISYEACGEAAEEPPPAAPEA